MSPPPGCGTRARAVLNVQNRHQLRSVACRLAPPSAVRRPAPGMSAARGRHLRGLPRPFTRERPSGSGPGHLRKSSSGSASPRAARPAGRSTVRAVAAWPASDSPLVEDPAAVTSPGGDLIRLHHRERSPVDLSAIHLAGPQALECPREDSARIDLREADALAASAHRAQVIDEAFQVALFVSTPSPCHLDHEHLPRFQ